MKELEGGEGGFTRLERECVKYTVEVEFLEKSMAAKKDEIKSYEENERTASL